MALPWALIGTAGDGELPAGLLLHGPAGSGKTFACRAACRPAAAGSYAAPRYPPARTFIVDCEELAVVTPGVALAALNRAFAAACAFATGPLPWVNRYGGAVIILDRVDAIAVATSCRSGIARHPTICAALKNLAMASRVAANACGRGHITIVGTSRLAPDALDSIVFGPGAALEFAELCKPPDHGSRVALLSAFFTHESDVDLAAVAVCACGVHLIPGSPLPPHRTHARVISPVT